MAKLKKTDVLYYWARPSALAEECGVKPQDWVSKIPEPELYKEYAKICLHLEKIPTSNELRIATRELKTRTHSIKNLPQFDRQFRIWLKEQSDDVRKILDFPGWDRRVALTKQAALDEAPRLRGYSFHPYLPVCLQGLDVLARGDVPDNEAEIEPVATLFEHRCADAFRCLGFEVSNLGQGKGRTADCLAVAPRERYALIVDAKVRREGYALGTEDRKFLEYAVNHGRELRSKGLDNIYLVVVAAAFRERDLKQLSNYLTDSPIRSVDLITAKALMRIVEESIRERHSYALDQFDKILFGHKIINE